MSTALPRSVINVISAVSAFCTLTALTGGIVFGKNDDGRWDNSPNKQWFESLKIPGTQSSCCGVADAYLTDDWRQLADGSFEIRVRVKGEEKVVIVAKDRVLMNEAYTNPTGHGILFMGEYNLTPFCFIPAAQS